MEDYMTTTAAAKLIGCVDRRVRQLLIAGGLRGRKIGRDWWVEKASALAYRDSERKPGRKPNTKEG